MGGPCHRQTGRCRLALLLLGVIALVVSLAGARAPVTNRISNIPANGPHISQRAEEPALHVIYPKNRENKGQTDAITKLLDGLVVDRATIYASESKYLGIFFWSAPLTKSQVATVKAHPYVSSRRSIYPHFRFSIADSLGLIYWCTMRS